MKLSERLCDSRLERIGKDSSRSRSGQRTPLETLVMTADIPGGGTTRDDSGHRHSMCSHVLSSRRSSLNTRSHA